MDNVLIEGPPQYQVSLVYGLLHAGTLPSWIAQYKKNSYTVEKTRARPSQTGRKPKETWRND